MFASQPDAPLALQIDDLRVVRGDKVVLQEVTWHVPRGRVVGVLGPSGSGKTTLMRCIVGVQRIAAGTVTVLGYPAGHPSLRRRVGYMTQADAVYDDLSVVDNLLYGARLLGVDRERVEALIRQVELGDQRDQVVGTLSGGQRSRVSLAFALISEPDVVVLDEPTVGLDPVLRSQLWERFHTLARAGTTLLVSTHVMDEAERCDSLLLIRDAQAIANGSPNVLRDRSGTSDLEEAFLRLAGVDRTPVTS